MIQQNDAYNRLIAILQKLFQLDQADLDFGIYRIMNQKLVAWQKRIIFLGD